MEITSSTNLCLDSFLIVRTISPGKAFNLSPKFKGLPLCNLEKIILTLSSS